MYNRKQDSEVEDLPPEQVAKKGRKKDGNTDHVAESIQTFQDLDEAAQKVARTFNWKYGDKEEESVKWNILAEGEQIVSCPMETEHATKEADDVTATPEPASMDHSNAGLRVALPLHLCSTITLCVKTFHGAKTPVKMTSTRSCSGTSSRRWWGRRGLRT